MALDYKKMGNRIREIRIEKDLTQEHLAEALNVSIAYISRIETGATHINLKRLNDLAAYLEVSESYLLNGTEIEKSKNINNKFGKILKDYTAEDK